MDCSYCYDPYMAMNIFCGSDGRSYTVEPYRSGDGVNRFDYNWIGYAWDGSYGQFPGGGRSWAVGHRLLRQQSWVRLQSLRVFQRQLQLDDLHAVDAKRQFRLQLCGRNRIRGAAATADVEDGQQLDVE
jgi:hypothetical protein